MLPPPPLPPPPHTHTHTNTHEPEFGRFEVIIDILKQTVKLTNHSLNLNILGGKVVTRGGKSQAPPPPPPRPLNETLAYTHIGVHLQS